MTIRDLAEAEPVGAAGDRPVALPAPSAISAVSALSDADDDVDAAIALVGPPFTRTLAGTRAVRASAVIRMRRSGGGVGPGPPGRDAGASWPPETALLAWSAAALGWRQEAEQLLSWLDGHRTAVGALAEKVGDDGAPAGPAPLAWTCALVVLAVVDANLSG